MNIDKKEKHRFYEASELCGTDCLRKKFHNCEEEQIELHKKTAGHDCVQMDGKLYFRIESSAVAPDRPCGSYANTHYQSLCRLKEHPVAGVIPVLELCECTYAVPFLDGRMLFDANTIPDNLRSRQMALLDQQSVMIEWSDFARWIRGLAGALRSLHRLGVAHGDVTVFNIIIDRGGDAVWLDLENLNSDPEQIENDNGAFLFHVFCLLFEQLSAFPPEFPERISKLVLEAADGDELLSGMAEVISADLPLEGSCRERNRGVIFQLLGRWNIREDNSGFLASAWPYVMRSAVYFQSDFLWLVNYNMKVMHYEKVGLYDLYRKLGELSETVQRRDAVYIDIKKQLSAAQEELGQLRISEANAQKVFAGKYSSMTAELAAAREKQRAVESELATFQENYRDVQNILQKEQRQRQEWTEALCQSESALAVTGNELKHLREILNQERALYQKTADALRKAERNLKTQNNRYAVLRTKQERLEQKLEDARHLRQENTLMQQNNAVLHKMLSERERELKIVMQDAETLREQLSCWQRQIAGLTVERDMANERCLCLETELVDTNGKLKLCVGERDKACNIIAGYEKKFMALQELSARAARDAGKLSEMQYRKDVAQKNERQSLDLLSAVREMVRNLCEHPSFRVAKLIQLLKHPEYAGFSGRGAAIWQLLRSVILRRPFCRDYLALNGLLRFMDDGIRAIHTPEPLTEEQKIQPPDESLLISVILPVYNQADMLSESIDSVVRQTYRNWELIVLNDGSTDDVAAVMRKYESDSRIHYLVQPNQKLPKALSNAFKYAKGELLTWTSADNNMRPEMLSRLSAFLRLNPQIDMVYADYAVIDNNGNPLHAAWFRPQNKYIPDSDELHLPHNTELLNVIKDNFIGASFMYRRNIMNLIGDYDPQLGVEDYDYWMRINDLCKIAHLGTDEILYDYRVHDNSLNGKARELKILEKSIQLMEYEKTRFAFYHERFEIYGSYHEGDLDFGSFEAGYVSGGLAEHNGSAKRILLLKGSELGTWSDDDFAGYDFCAAFFDLNEEKYCGKFATKIRRNHIHCFARPQSVAAGYLAMFVPNHVECMPGEFGRWALCAANNRIFWDKTRTPQETALIPAAPGIKLQGAIVILLEQIGTGGMEQMAVDMARHFASEGRRTIIVCVKDFRANFNAPEGVVFKPLDIKSPESDFRQLLESEKPDAVIAHYTVWGAEAVAGLKIPFYQVLHNTYIWFQEEQCAEYRQNDRFTTAYFAVSATVAWDAVTRLALPPEKIIVWENGIDYEKFFYSERLRTEQRSRLQLRDGDILIVNPASCYGAKGQLHLIHAFAGIAPRYPHLRLIMAGKILEDHYAEKIRTVIQEHHLENQVCFGDFYADMNALYNAADAVVMASFWEGCSLAVAEAVRCGCPIVSTITGDVERQTGNVPGLLLELPVQLSELNYRNIGTLLYEPNSWLIEKLGTALERVANGEFGRLTATVTDRSAADVYSGYLRAVDMLGNGFSPQAVRHNIRGTSGRNC